MEDKEIPTPADVKAQKEAQYKNSLKYAVIKARERKARIIACNGDHHLQNINNLMIVIKNLKAEIRRLKGIQ